MRRQFYTATEDEIKRARVTDIYFVHTKQILENEGLAKSMVIAEATSGNLPERWPWAILCGVEELTHLFKDVPVDVYSMPEGSIFYSKDCRGVREPVLRIEGPYVKFCLYETALLGLICQSSGIATRAGRIRKRAGNRRLISFGIRRMHPSISPMIDRAAFIGGFDAVSCLLGAHATETEPVGTMPHSLVVVFRDQVKAWKAFDRSVGKDVRRVALIDTYSDEKSEAIMAAKTLDNLKAVRLDTPSSRKGDFAEIVREVRWELDLRGYDDIEIFISGGLDEHSVEKLAKAGADAFGVGTFVSNAPTVNFALDIVEINKRPCAKKGKLGGRKEVWRCDNCLSDLVVPYDSPQPKCPTCHGETKRMLKQIISRGEVVAELPKPIEIRKYVLNQLKRAPSDCI